jgi:hypothetical protein
MSLRARTGLLALSRKQPAACSGAGPADLGLERVHPCATKPLAPLGGQGLLAGNGTCSLSKYGLSQSTQPQYKDK